MASKCKRTKVVITKKNKATGKKKVIAEFMGRQGSGCGPRKKPSTAHLRVFKAVMKEAAPSCKRGAKGNVRAYRKCIGDAVKQVARG